MTKQFPGIEILRFLSAIAILVVHYHQFLDSAAPHRLSVSFSEEMQPLYSSLYVFYKAGNCAVSVFWELSGFIFFWKYGEAIFIRSISWSQFFVLRLSRLYPLFLATLLATLVLQQIYIASHGMYYVSQSNNLYFFILNIFMASEWWTHKEVFSFNLPAWSISTEVLVYAIFFTIARRIRLNFSNFAIIIAASIVLRLAVPLFKEVEQCMLYFFLGGAVHLLIKERGGAATVCAILFISGSALTAINVVTNGKFHTAALVLVSTTLLIIFVGAGQKMNRRWTHISQALGDTTYSSYLIHFPAQILIVLITDYFGISRAVYLSPVALVAYLTGVFFIAFLSYRLFERPVQDKLRKATLLMREKQDNGVLPEKVRF